MIPTKKICVGYIENNNQLFVSEVVSENNSLQMLSKFVNLVKLPIDFFTYDKGVINNFHLDYLYADFSLLRNFNILPFILREKKRFSIPFLIRLHVVYGWERFLTLIVPLLKKQDA